VKQGPPLFRYVGTRIRELRENYPPKGLSQEALAKKLETTANTVSRWETATYKPTLEDLEALSRVFAVSILEFFPGETPKDEKVQALLRSAKDLPEDELEELRHYAQFRQARYVYRDKPRARLGRPPKRKAS
jgi:transcriptional regulator with XRE-family HTH domain